MKIKIAALVNDSIVDGPGLRYAVYVQGCPHRCEGCHNPQTHDTNGGTETDTAEIWRQIAANPLLDGITFSGGEPMSQPRALAELAAKARELGLNIWCYTGHCFEELAAKGEADIDTLLSYIDVLVDGPFVLAQRTLELPFRGSANQRLIDVPESFARGEVCEIKRI